MFHLTQRVPWHDAKWDGTVCRRPDLNPYCVCLQRIREEKVPENEITLAGIPFSDLEVEQLPPCAEESGIFMNAQEWHRRFVHPYSEGNKTRETHGHLLPTTFPVPEYSTFAVPFRWMLRNNQEWVGRQVGRTLPEDVDPPFKSPWVFDARRQVTILNHFFDSLTAGTSLVAFYTKEGHPLGDALSRVVVGIGRITRVSPIQWYDSPRGETYPTWERLVHHSIRPDGSDGFLLPYHEYIEDTGDPDENSKRLDLLREIVVAPARDRMFDFSYAAERAGPDSMLATLTDALSAVRAVRRHGIAPGPWDLREGWLNDRLAETWEDRGAFPGLGASLEAFGVELGSALAFELTSNGTVTPDMDPWPVIDGLFNGTVELPHDTYRGTVDALANTWRSLPEERRALLELISRFALTPDQAKRWFEPTKRSKATVTELTDIDLLSNPYRMVETDLGDDQSSAVSIGLIDRGLLPDSSIAAQHPVPPPATVSSTQDERRVRAAMVWLLRKASDQGDSLLSLTEVLERLETMDLTREITVGTDWVRANAEAMAGVIDVFDLVGDGGESTTVLQLAQHRTTEQRLAKILEQRARKPVRSLEVDWKSLIAEAIRQAGGSIDPYDERHAEALADQAHALERITTRRVGVLVGRAGTGKTSVLGALLRAPAINRDGVLLLAPTGKARVRLGRATGKEARTIAQFLYSLKRYDGLHQRSLFEGKDKYKLEKTVVIDECSMLTMDDLFAVLQALDMAHVERLILVGDPNQLPPIGVGRPFADLVARLEQAEGEDDDLGGALGRLTQEMRTVQGERSDILRLASWFTSGPQPVDADRVLSEVASGTTFRDLKIHTWSSMEELQQKLLGEFVTELGLEHPTDVDKFNEALGFDELGQLRFAEPDGAESFQLLSPVRMQPHGVFELNRWIQRVFHQYEVTRARQPGGIRLGDEEIVHRDKVIQLRNQTRRGWDHNARETVEEYLANGEIGVAAYGKKGYLNIVFAGRPDRTFGYHPRQFGEDGAPLELAYALTVHKAQGSQFGKVFMILPRHSRLLSRELLYTALTRAQDRLILFAEGDDLSMLYGYTKPESSETARRNTNLFYGSVRARAEQEIPYAEHLIHKTLKGHLVRSKSELVIANMLYEMGMDYTYEREFFGADGIRVRPDFSFVDAAGDLIIWEHLGMLTREDYRRGWEWKRGWYKANGYDLGKNLHTTEDDGRGGLDSSAVRETAEAVRALI